MTGLRVIAFDLDETLWPLQPTLDRAEAVLHRWLRGHAPRIARHLGVDALRAHRRRVARERPELAWDVTALRREHLRRLLAEWGYPPGMAEEALAAFRAARDRVEPYPDVRVALGALSRRYRLVAVSNGNARLERTPLAGYLDAAFHAAGLGVAKPDPGFFRALVARLGVGPGAVMHVGDDPERDVEAARRAGLRTAWVNRAGRPWPAALEPPALTVPDLEALCDRLLA